MKRDGIAPALPQIETEYIADWLFEIGPVVPAGMGKARIGWQDIAAWSALSGVEPEPWEAKLLRSLSGAYLAMSLDAEDPQCPAPYQDEASIARNRRAVADKLERGFKTMEIAAAFRRTGQKG